MNIKVLGTGCMKCNRFYSQVEKVIAETGVQAELEKVERIDLIMSYGVVLTPALVIDGEVKSSGKIPTDKEIARWLKETVE